MADHGVTSPARIVRAALWVAFAWLVLSGLVALWVGLTVRARDAHERPQRRGDDGLTDRQRKRMSDRYERTLGATPDAATFARARARYLYERPQR